MDWTSIGPHIGQIIKHLLSWIAALSVVVEFTPIKVHPISWILRWIGKQTNQELLKEVSLVQFKIKEMETKVNDLEKSDIVNCRVRILTFADEIRRDVLHSKETFDQVLSDIDTYEKYCREHPDFMNNKTVAAKEKILEVYSRCIDNNDFL